MKHITVDGSGTHEMNDVPFVFVPKQKGVEEDTIYTLRQWYGHHTEIHSQMPVEAYEWRYLDGERLNVNGRSAVVLYNEKLDALNAQEIEPLIGWIKVFFPGEDIV